jgi:TonB family protein
MRDVLLRTALATVRVWTKIYTAGIPAPLRDARREEIESDLWETQRQPHTDPDRRSALHVVARLVAGAPDDLGWRREQVNAMTRTTRVSTLVVFAGALLAIGVGIASLMTSATPGSLPAPSLRPLRARVTYPPPPPPPLAVRSPFDTATSSVTLKYAQTSYAAIGGMPLPRKITDVRPVHAPIAVANGVNGTVLIEATIDETGRVADAHILQSVPMLDQSAVDALKRWEFEPTILKGNAVPVTIRVTVDYKS